ncbi:MAG: hypothetical protein JO161_01975, partial [Planctomycetaceae bacterium]|nr:hypothetical protein [Planctomycetaceae bacterium]
MPSRLMSLVILVYWCVAAFLLLTWEILPELSLGYPPDLRAIASAGEAGKPVRFSIQVIDNPKLPDIRRAVGEAIVASRRQPDGWYELSSRLSFDAGGLLEGKALGVKSGVRLEMASIYRVDTLGNLHSFDLKVTSRDAPEMLFIVNGRLHGGVMEVVSKSPLPVLNQKFSFPYEPRSVVQDALGPVDRLPGLHIGQRWDSRIISPFSGEVEKVRVEVRRRDLIHWNGEPVSALEVVQHAGPITTSTWVRSDGLIL